ncbi:hypothetical protein SLT36_20925 [Aminobacter sp. BA135]|uniref:hypothetical protein n=1 Tax=Aminobacter sp. BA135 TaxID=537596 RepID=UPI003D7A4B31
MVADISSVTAEQTRLDRMLTRGIVFSVIRLAGFGSCFAPYQGMRALRMIKANPRLQEHGRAMWCIIVGGLGALALLTVVGIGLFNAAMRP